MSQEDSSNLGEYIEFKLTSKVDDHRPIYITGNFNNWNPRDARYKMTRNEDSSYEIKIPVHETFPSQLEYKYTKGGWENVEIDKFGNIIKNRAADINQTRSLHDHIALFRENWAPYKEKFFPIVELISDHFEIPQLDRTRRVWALLPYNYYETQKSYPVLYLQDAQNLFAEGSEYGNWEIDKKLSILAEYGRGEVIIIAVEHGGENRMKEYMFETNSLVLQGDGKKYIRFITDTLKPFIDNKYRTLKDRDNTGIGGSSLGGLISIYGGFLYPEVYSKLMIFSPSLWAVPKINFPMLKFYNPFKIKVYLYGGEKEGSQMIEKMRSFKKLMDNYDDDKEKDLEFRISVNPEGEHAEFYWSQEFPKAIEWLYYDTLDDPFIIKEEQNESNTTN